MKTLWGRGLLVFTLTVALAVFLVRGLSSGFFGLSSVDLSPSRGDILFTGDIMLGRNVERELLKKGLNPLENMKAIHERYNSVVINFEAAIPKIHKETPNMSFSLSVATSSLFIFDDVRVTHASLANNHGLDFGEDGYQNTQRVLRERGIVTFGHPKTISSEISLISIPYQGGTLGLIGLNATWGSVHRDALESVFLKAKKEHDYFVGVYVHWGPEYETVANETLRDFAKVLVSHGADMIVGHHPHVVADIDYIDGVPVFYSLGNYVFDQYWNEEVRTELLSGVTFHGRTVEYEIIPVWSERSNPEPMEGERRTEFLRKLSSLSHEDIRESVASGIITLRQIEGRE